MKTTSKCQVTLPRRLREEVGIKPRQEVETFVIEHAGRMVIALAPKAIKSKGVALASGWVGCLKNQGSTDEILAEARGRE
ncbi:MAG: AbrB/MazE/SpoVT family DNA-binding domain-containing protein [Terrimicrobiaceae bacterium]